MSRVGRQESVLTEYKAASRVPTQMPLQERCLVRKEKLSTCRLLLGMQRVDAGSRL